MTFGGAERRFQIRAQWLLALGATLVAACAAPRDGGPAITGVTPPTGQPPDGTATRGAYTVSGVLTLRTTSGTAPLAYKTVSGFLILPSGYSYTLAPVVTDADGRYQFSNLPNGAVVLRGVAPRTYQPCPAIARVSGAKGVKDVELVDSAATGSEVSKDSPTLSGVVYRKTSAGRQPVRGAIIEFERSIEVTATTFTDGEGRYSLCQLPIGRAGLDVWLNGGHLTGALVDITGDDVLDLVY